MLIYVAICTTHDPEIDNSSDDKEIIGIFSDIEYAQNAFDRQEKRTGSSGNWIATHICFRGEHAVYEYEIDAWGKSYNAYWLFTNNVWKEYRIK